MSDPAIIPDKKANYLALITNSIGSNMFRNVYVTNHGLYQDVTEDGINSCAYFVSFLLSGLRMIQRPHATVLSTQKDLEESSWMLVDTKDPIISGDVIIWEAIEQNGVSHRHIGFAISQTEAISNSWTKRTPQKHLIDHHVDGKNRKVESVYRYHL